MPKKDKSITIYYDAQELDIKRLFNYLRAQKGSRFEHRRDSDLGFLAISEWLSIQLKNQDFDEPNQKPLL